MSSFIGRMRLRMLASFLEKNAEEIAPNFNMKHWAMQQGSQRNGTQLLASCMHTCDTAACAVGWAGSLARFRIQGLKTVKRGAFMPEYKGLLEWKAVEKFFGLSEKDATTLFVSMSYPGGQATPSQVASRIRYHLVAR